MKIVALIPARSGSKGIVNKNVRFLAGKPLILHAIHHALKSKLISQTYVSSDSSVVREIALEAGVKFSKRPKDLAGDYVTDWPVVKHFYNELEVKPDVIIYIRCTSPIHSPNMIDEALSKAELNSFDSIRCITKSKQSPYKSWRLSDDGKYLKSLLGSPQTPCFDQPRQVLPDTYWQTGHFDILNMARLLELDSFSGVRIKGFMVDPKYVFDIDTEDDWVASDAHLLQASE